MGLFFICLHLVADPSYQKCVGCWALFGKYHLWITIDYEILNYEQIMAMKSGRLPGWSMLRKVPNGRIGHHKKGKW